MPDPIGPIATLPPSAPVDPLAALRPQSRAAMGGNEQLLDPQAFLRLLVAQLRYQDPTEPVDTGEFMQQTATLSQVQTMNSLADAVVDMIAAQQTSTASSMVGRVISFVDPGGTQSSGRVDSVSFHDGVPLLHVGSVGVPLAGVLEVTDPAPAGAASGTGDDGTIVIPGGDTGGSPTDPISPPEEQPTAGTDADPDPGTDADPVPDSI